MTAESLAAEAAREVERLLGADAAQTLGDFEAAETAVRTAVLAVAAWANGSRSDHDAFDLVDRHRVRRPVVELRRLRRRVPRDVLGVLEGPPVRQVRRDPRRPERVADVDDGSSACAARRLIIARTTRLCSARPVSRRPAGSTLWKSAAFGSSR